MSGLMSMMLGEMVMKCVMHWDLAGHTGPEVANSCSTAGAKPPHQGEQAGTEQATRL